MMLGRKAIPVRTETSTETGHREQVRATATNLPTFYLILLSFHNAVKGKPLKVQAGNQFIWVQILCNFMSIC